MRTGFALFAAGLAALLIQGGVATFIAPPYCPDFAFLVVVAIGLLWDRDVPGLVVASLLGYAADLLSGSLLGQHALLRLFVFVSARIASRRVNIRGALPVACFAAGSSVVYGLALGAVTDFYTGAAPVSWGWLADLLRHALINGICAPVVLRGVDRLISRVEEGEAGRRPLHLEPRQRAV